MGSNTSRPEDDGVITEAPSTKKIKDVFRLSTGVGDVPDGSNPTLLQYDVFQTMFSLSECDDFGRLLLAYIKVRLKNINGFSLEEFVEIGEEFMQLSGHGLIGTYWDIFTGAKLDITEEALSLLFKFAFTFTCVTSGYKRYLTDETKAEADKQISSLVKSVLKSSEKVYRQDLIVWVQRKVPHLFSGVHSWVTGVWSDLEWKRNLGQVTFGDDEDELILKASAIINLPRLWILSCCLPHVYRLSTFNPDDEGSADFSNSWNNRMKELLHWLPLYNSNDHGTSINRFCHHVLEYSGPTVLFLQFEDDNVYCLAVDEHWRESSGRWGSNHMTLIKLNPVFEVVLSGSGILFFNTQLRGVPKGIQIGRDHRSMVLEINEELTTVTQYGTSFKLLKLEVWGCGSDEARKAQLEQRQWEQREVNKLKNRKLKIEDWKDSPDRLLLSMGGVKVNNSECLHPVEDKNSEEKPT